MQDLNRKIPRALAAKLLAFLELKLTGQAVLDIRDGEIRAAKITEAVRMKDFQDDET